MLEARSFIASSATDLSYPLYGNAFEEKQKAKSQRKDLDKTERKIEQLVDTFFESCVIGRTPTVKGRPRFRVVRGGKK